MGCLTALVSARYWILPVLIYCHVDLWSYAVLLFLLYEICWYVYLWMTVSHLADCSLLFGVARRCMSLLFHSAAEEALPDCPLATPLFEMLHHARSWVLVVSLRSCLRDVGFSVCSFIATWIYGAMQFFLYFLYELCWYVHLWVTVSHLAD